MKYYFLHFLFLLFVLLIPLSNIPALLFLHVVTCITLLIHWWMGSERCILTKLEGVWRGMPDEETMTYGLVAPIYKLDFDELISYKRLRNGLIYLITIILMTVSVYKLYVNRLKISMGISCIGNMRSMMELGECLRLFFV